MTTNERHVQALLDAIESSRVARGAIAIGTGVTYFNGYKTIAGVVQSGAGRMLTVEFDDYTLELFDNEVREI